MYAINLHNNLGKYWVTIFGVKKGYIDKLYEKYRYNMFDPTIDILLHVGEFALEYE